MNEFDAHVFFGTSPDFALIIAGMHVSEQSGIEVAHWIRTQLAARSQPTRLGAIVIPEVFPGRGLEARAAEWTAGPARWDGGVGGNFREYPDGRHPNRHFPPPGKPLAFLDKGILKTIDGKDVLDGKTRKPIQQIAEIRRLIQVIEAVKPVIIVSVHGKRRRTTDDLTKAANAGTITMTKDEIAKWTGDAIKGVNFTGIYVDPRYSPCHPAGFDVEDCKFDLAKDPAYPNTTKKGVVKQFDSAISTDGQADDALALKIAKAVKDATLVAGNHLTDAPEVVHYAKEPAGPGFSLGDWGPADVSPVPGSTSGARPGAPVFTIEVDEDHESWAFLDGVQYMDENGQPIPQPKRPSPKARPAKFDKARSVQLQDYAQAIIAACLT